MSKDKQEESAVPQAENKKGTELKFSYDIIIAKYPRQRAALAVLLDKGGSYTLAEVDKKLSAFLKREVK